MAHLVGGLLCVAQGSGAQARVTAPTLGSVIEDRARVAALLGRGEDAGLLRDGGVSTLAPAGFRLVRPEAQVVFNESLVTSLADGPLWSGRGSNVLLRGGASWRRGRVAVVLIPEVTSSENRPVDVVTVSDPARSAWSNPWRTPATPADLPLRYGAERFSSVRLGQSALTVDLGRVAVGIGTGNLWWGPGIRNALVLSDNAPGIPRLFVRTPRPLVTPAGTISGEWFVGGLTESPFFDTVSTNDVRAVGGLALTLAPRGVPGLTVGIARAVVAPIDGAGAIPSRILDVISTWNGGGARDQMSAFFGRWMVPGGGLEVYGEYAWQRLPSSTREWLTAPNADAGWTAGAQWALARGATTWRTQLEFTDVAQTRVDPSRAPRDWGTGIATPQGMTQQGRMLGVNTGPGSTHAWLAVDRIGERATLGAFVARTRWENDAMYRQPRVIYLSHDVSLFAGVRAGYRTPLMDLHGSLAVERRFNYLFRDEYREPLLHGGEDPTNLRATLRLYPR